MSVPISAEPAGSAASTMLPRVAAAVILGMVLMLWAELLFRDRLESAVGTSGYGTTAGIVIGAVAIPIVVGLWLRAAWAWWAGLIAAVWQLISHLLYLIVTTASGATVGLIGWLVAALLAAFLAVLLLPGTRTACMRRA